MSNRLNLHRGADAALSPELFRALVRSKGHSLASLARLWGLTRARLSQVAADPARAPHYVFALLGTPRRRGRRLLMASEGLQSRLQRQDFATELETGEVFIVRDSPGEHLPEGEEGVVLQLLRSRGRLQALLRFEAVSYEEQLEVSYLLSPACYLARSGRLRQC